MKDKHKNPYWNFEKIMEIERKYGVRSTFFFLEESKKFDFNPKSIPLCFGYYSFDDVKDIIQKLSSEGWEIGLHGSYDSYRDINLLRKEKRRLEKIAGIRVKGVRQHYLNLNIPNTWKIQKKVGFKYDSSFGFNEKTGWRDEKLLPFKPFNDDFLVIPLTIMDVALMREAKFNINIAKEIIKNHLRYAKKRGAVVTVLWHQRVFNDKEFPGWADLYKFIIREGKNMDAWFVKCEDIYEVFK